MKAISYIKNTIGHGHLRLFELDGFLHGWVEDYKWSIKCISDLYLTYKKIHFYVKVKYEFYPKIIFHFEDGYTLVEADLSKSNQAD